MVGIPDDGSTGSSSLGTQRRFMEEMTMTDLLELRDKVQRTLVDTFSDVRVDSDGDFVIPYESTSVFVRCSEQGEGDSKRTLVAIFAVVLSEVNPTPELFEFVAVHADDWVFGHICTVRDKDSGLNRVLMRHTLLGDYLDAEELRSAVVAIVVSADRLDDEMKETFGGKRFREK